MSRIPESALVLPALECIYDAGGRLSTTKLRACLTEKFGPDGEDAAILDGRSDTKFDQKVRNLKSHKTLSRLGWAVEYRGGFELTGAGRKMVQKIRAPS
jgi:hypothetical protein